MYKLSFSNILLLLFPLVAFFFTLLFWPSYIAGDQIYYRKFYEDISILSLSQALLLSPSYIGSNYEPVSICILWIFSALHFPHDVASAVLNSLLVFFVSLFLNKHLQLNFLTGSLFLTNYYILVLSFSAERLKIAYILIAAFLCLRSHTFGRLFFIASFLSHIQMLILSIPPLTSRFLCSMHSRISLRLRTVHIFSAIFSLVAVTAIFFVLPGIFIKLPSYLISFSSSNFLASLLLVLFGLIALPHRQSLFLCLFPLCILSGALASSRINIVIFSYLFFSATIQSRLTSLPFLMLLMYFSIKSSGFIYCVITSGQGFC